MSFSTRNEGITMANHFMENYNQAKTFSVISADEQLVDEIMGHYPCDIQRSWISHRDTSVLGILEFLQKIDGVDSV